MLSETPQPTTKKVKLAPDHIKIKRQKVQLLETPEEFKKSASKNNSYLKTTIC